VKFNTYIHLVLRLRIGEGVPLLPPHVYMAYTGKNLFYNISKGSPFQARSQSREKDSSLQHICQSLYPSFGPVSWNKSVPTGRIFVEFCFRDFIAICRDNPSLVKTGQIYQEFTLIFQYVYDNTWQPNQCGLRSRRVRCCVRLLEPRNCIYK